MKLSSFVVVAFQIYGMHWFIQVFRTALPFVESQNVSLVLPFVGVVFAGVLCWCASGRMSRLVTRGYDVDVTLGTCTREDLYSFAFLLAGLYFAMNSFGPALNWIHYFLKTSAAELDPENSSSLYEAATTFVTLITSAFLLFASNRWARRLIKIQEAKI